MRNRPRVFLPLAVILGLVASLSLAGVVLAAETTLSADLAGVTEGDNPAIPTAAAVRRSSSTRRPAPRAGS